MTRKIYLPIIAGLFVLNACSEGLSVARSEPAAPGPAATENASSDSSSELLKRIEDLESRLSEKVLPEPPAETDESTSSETTSSETPQGTNVRPPVVEFRGIASKIADYDPLSGGISPTDSAGPKVIAIFADRDSRSFLVYFNEVVDFEDVRDRGSIDLFVWTSEKTLLSVKGQLLSGDSHASSNLVRFVADEAIFRDAQGTVKAIYALRVYGADSEDASRAAVDAAGHPTTRQVTQPFVCFDGPGSYDPTREILCQ